MNYYDLIYIVIGKGINIQYNKLIAFNKWKLFFLIMFSYLLYILLSYYYIRYDIIF